jgi:hypothetical protein
MTQASRHPADRRKDRYVNMSEPPTRGFLFAQAILGNPVRVLRMAPQAMSDGERFVASTTDRTVNCPTAPTYAVVSEAYFFAQQILGMPLDESLRSATDVTPERFISEAGWNPADHPRGGFPQNPGWFSTTGGKVAMGNLTAADARRPTAAPPRPIAVPLTRKQIVGSSSPGVSGNGLRAQGAVQHVAQPNTATTYDATKSSLSGGLIFGGYMKAGDKVVNTQIGTITVGSSNLEGTDRDFQRATSVLADLGLKLPQSENGVYWSSLPRTHDGYTVVWKGVANDQLAFSFINSAYQGAKIESPDFEQLMVTLWHEVTGHNVDDARHDNKRDQAAFDAKYEKPVFEAIKRAKANGTWKKILEKAAKAFP